MKITKSIISNSYETGKSLIKDEETYIKEIEGKIKDFTTESTKDLQGQTYDALRNFYLQVLLKIIELRRSVKEELEKANETTNSEWSTFISPYVELDDSEIYDLEQQASTLDNLIRTFDYKNATKIEKASYDGWKRGLYEINKLLTKLKLLQPTDSTISTLIETSTSKIEKYQTAISGLERMFTSKV